MEVDHFNYSLAQDTGPSSTVFEQEKTLPQEPAKVKSVEQDRQTHYQAQDPFRIGDLEGWLMFLKRL